MQNEELNKKDERKFVQTEYKGSPLNSSKPLLNNTVTHSLILDDRGQDTSLVSQKRASN